jgi:thiosulfate dehydrogenase (quinone) large subunit
MNVEHRSMSFGALRYATVFLRFALGAAFLTAVTDRLGIWGPSGTANVAWGDMTHFMAYAAKLNPWFPKKVIPTLAWFVTVAETSLGAALILGFETRRAAQLSGWLLLAFGIGMTAGTGVKSALNASVFSASAGAFLLATSPEYPLSIDSLRQIGKREAAPHKACISAQLKNTCTISLDSNGKHRNQ